MTPVEPVLRIEALSTVFATASSLVRAVDDVSFDIARGTAVGLVGESGSGKSTVALSILGLLGPGGRIANGRILFRGEDLLAKKAEELRRLRGNRLGMVFQDPLTTLTPSLTVGEQIAETVIVHKNVSRRAAWQRAVELLGLVGIPDATSRARQYPHHLSGGMRQRVSIAIALSCEPELVILDEPTTALDVTVQAQILELLDQLRRDLHLSMLFITHDLGVVAQVCDAVCVLYGGRLVEQATVADLFRAPLHPYTKGLLACVPGLESETRRLPYIPGRVPDLSDLPVGCVFAPRCPFAEGRCRDRQALHAAADRRRVACWKFEALAVRGWPAQEAEALEAARPPTGATLVTVGLCKDYTLTGFWHSLRVVRNSGTAPRLRWAPRRLRAVDDVSISLVPGETLGLVGESGCGKSTVSRMLVGLVSPTAGEVWMDGQRVNGTTREEVRRRVRKDVQLVFQDPESSLNPRKPVGAILARPLILYGLARGGRVGERVAELLDAVQLSPAYAARYPYQLSGGEKQRVGIARALAAEPRFVICDEPVSALDVSVRASILNVLGDLKRRFGLGYLFIAHDLAVVKHISNRIAVMYRGRICELGTAEAIFAPPHHPYTWALLSAIPVPDYAARKRQRVDLPGSVTSRQPGQPGCVFEDRCPVKIGAVCEETTPPSVEVSPGHWIACHHPTSFLRTLDPARSTAAFAGP